MFEPCGGHGGYGPTAFQHFPASGISWACQEGLFFFLGFLYWAGIRRAFPNFLHRLERQQRHTQCITLRRCWIMEAWSLDTVDFEPYVHGKGGDFSLSLFLSILFF
jgi:hypothetical protein